MLSKTGQNQYPLKGGGCSLLLVVVGYTWAENKKWLHEKYNFLISLTILTARKPVFLKIRSDEKIATTISVLPTGRKASG